MKEVYIISAVRTPFGSFGGSQKDIHTSKTSNGSKRPDWYETLARIKYPFLLFFQKIIIDYNTKSLYLPLYPT